MSLIPTYPNVPNVPGVPPLIRQASAVQNTVQLLVGDVLAAVRLFFPPRWGLFDSTGFQSVLAVNSTVEVGFRSEHRISTAQQEQGAFMSYDKVETPYEGKLTVNTSGAFNVALLLAQLQALQPGLTLYTLVMPEFSYPNMNITHHDFTRSQRHGAYLLTVDIWLEQVRVVGAPQFSKTASPSGANSVSSGTVQPQTPSASTLGGSGISSSGEVIT